MLYQYFFSPTLWLWLFVGVCWPVAQAQTPVYKGLRLSVYGLEIVRQSQDQLLIRCDMANTGRYRVEVSRKRRPPTALLIEYDTAQLPALLVGKERYISRALLSESFALKPGAVRGHVLVSVQFRKTIPELDTAKWMRSFDACGDLKFDTVYVRAMNNRTATVLYRLRNTGTRPVHLFARRKGNEISMAVNAYFTLSQRLTRGALLAEGIFLKQGRETLDGVVPVGGFVEGTLEVPLKTRTKFTPYLLLELDPFQTTDECDRRNNTKAVAL